MAFRFPGNVCDEQSFWEVLQQGRDVVSQIGDDRWAVDELSHSKRSEPGRSITFSAGTLSRIKEFDASFFGISPREAAWLDPQQRILLELAWEAMENSGQIPGHMAGSDCAVYVGISGLDYGVRGIADLASISSHSMTGNTLSVAANRISYIFDLHGPSLAVDTACSSSLVALHQACNSLRSGESSVALVGSVNMLLHPYPFVGFTKASMISANGRCRTFDASADGYVRAEGGGMLLLKPLSQAKADGDVIQAVILASGVNADGGRKTGITIPSSEGQAELMRSVLGSTKLESHQVDYVEAHGTGTAVGDPIEASAIGEVYGKGRDAPLPIGSVKTNLGHLEAASGMAGLVKTVLMLKHQALAPSLHYVTPNPNIDFTKLNLQVSTQSAALTKQDKKPLVMAVNSFGFGGTNAHVILQAHPMARRAVPKSVKHLMPPLFLSAKTHEALQQLAGRYADLMQSKDAPLYYDIAYSAAFHRQHLEKRLAVFAPDREAIAGLLKRFSHKENVPEVLVEEAPAEPPRLVFVYTGNGAHWTGMGQRLLRELPRFAEIIKELDTAMASRAGFSILDEMQAKADNSRLDDTIIAQPLLFAIQVAITTLLREKGIQPDATAGHSVGEVAAAWACGALTLEQAINLVCARSSAQAKTQGKGRMAAVGLSEAGIRAILSEGAFRTIEVAAINSPSNVTLSGDLKELELLQATLKAKNIFFRLLDLDYAFHSHFMDPVKQDFTEHLGDIQPESSQTDFISTVTGDVFNTTGLNADYWWNNIRKPVRFAGAINALIRQGGRIFVEIGPHGILQRYITECLDNENVSGRVLSSLRRNDDSPARIDELALRLAMLAKNPDLQPYFPQKGRFVPLPNYPWQRETHWLPKSSESYALIERKRVHPLLGWRLKETEASWENSIDPTQYSYLTDHRISGAIVFPASGYLEIALAAAQEWFGGNAFELEELEILHPIVFDGEHARNLRIEFTSREGTLRILSCERLSDEKWSVNAVCRLLGAPARDAESYNNIAFLEAGRSVKASEHYHLTHTVGLEYGPAFQAFSGGIINEDIFEGHLALPENLSNDRSHYLLHPVLMDGCFQTLVHFFREEIEAGEGMQFLPVKIGHARYFSGHLAPARFHVRLTKRGSRSVRAQCVVLDSENAIICALEDCYFRVSPMARKKEHDPAGWRIIPKLVPHPSDETSADILNSALLAKQVRHLLAEKQPAWQKYVQDGLPLLNALVIAFIYEAFGKATLEDANWLQHIMSDAAALPVTHRNYGLWLANCLKNEGLIKEKGGKWQMDDINAPPPAQEIWCTLLNDFPDALPELLSIGRIGMHLPDYLLGKQEIAHFMHTSSSLSGAGIHDAVQAMVKSISQEWPANQRLRILHISADADEFLRPLLNSLPSDRTDYTIATTETVRLDTIKTEYKSHAFVKTAQLDMQNLTLSAETKLPACFDVIILSQWLHTAAQPADTLAMLRGKMAPGGQIIIAECYPNLVTDFMCGPESSWWRHTGNSLSSRLAEPAQWNALLKSQGFKNMEPVSDPADEEGKSGAYLLLANKENIPTQLSKAAPAHWLIIYDTTGPSCSLGKALAKLLENNDESVTCVETGLELDGSVLDDPNTLYRFLADTQQTKGTLHHIVYLAGMHGEVMQPETAQANNARCTGALHLIQALAKQEASQPQLWLVTSGGALVSQPKTDWKVNPSEAPLWGLGRVVMNEYPALSCKLIDIALNPESPQAAERLRNELLMPDDESEVVLTADARFGLRMQREHPASSEQHHSRFRLDFHVSGQLRNLQWFPLLERQLEENEIEIRPIATGLNFRDVMYTMGMLPDEAVENGFAGASLGLEFSGIVSRTGKGINAYKAGDPVMGFGSACFASHIITTPDAITRKPDEWSFAQAATVPTAFFTVYYALKYLADLQPDEKILIHGAAGGIGIAAIQMAQYMGAEIFATVGNDEKRDFVHLLGADHILDSRSLTFAEDILAITNGEGVDVVLNSLAGEAVNRNLMAMKPFGRFLELGKRDFFENTHIGLRPFKNNISYFGIDADQLLISKPLLASRLFSEVMELFTQGKLSPLPYRSFSAERVTEAFRHMQQSRHIGKIIVDFNEARIAVTNNKEPASSLHFTKDSTYLVTGGVEGFGAESALWLAEHGVKHIVLVSRRGKNTPGAHTTIARLEALGAKAHIFACDVTDYAELEKVFVFIKHNLPPLRGILHAAMVLEDGLIKNMDAKRFSNVLSPKMLGVSHLHHLSTGIALDHFIVYSSITTYIGNPGQSNYVAANAYLEAFTQWRRSLGLPALCISWGPIEDAGYLTRNAAIKDSLAARLGAKPLNAKQALTKLESLLARSIDQIAIADFDFSSLSRLLPSAGASRFDILQEYAESSQPDDENAAVMLHAIVGKPFEEAYPVIRGILLTEAAKILSIHPDRIDPKTPLHDLGMDSLMTLELAMAAEQRFGITLPAMELSEESKTIDTISVRIARKLLSTEKEPEQDTMIRLVSVLAAQHAEEFSAEDISQTVADVLVTQGRSATA